MNNYIAIVNAVRRLPELLGVFKVLVNSLPRATPSAARLGGPGPAALALVPPYFLVSLCRALSSVYISSLLTEWECPRAPKEALTIYPFYGQPR